MGSISAKTLVNVNGVEQGMFVKGKDASKPVLLYVHGGMPDYFLTERYPTGLDEEFVVIWWEPRGSGLSFDPDMEPESLTAEQLVAVSYPLARNYYEQLDAPLKGFYTFEHSAHSPLFEEPAKTCEIMRADVLAGTSGRADPE